MAGSESAVQSAIADLRSRTGVVVLVGLLVAAAGAVFLSVLGPDGLAADDDGGTSGQATPAPDGSPGTSSDTGSIVGDTFPALALVSLDGRPISTRLEGAGGDARLVLVIWDSACDCADLFDLANEFATGAAGDAGDNVEVGVIGISYDSDLATAAQTAFDAGLVFPSALDRNGVVADTVGVQVPQVLVLDADGTIIEHFSDVPTNAELQAAVRK